MPRAGANPRLSLQGFPSRRHVLAGVAGGALLGLLPRGAAAQDIRYFRIGTGTTSGTYFPIGGLIANAISNPPGSRPCDRGEAAACRG
ncbi:TAXI family TRAP transporter solute-binding subunit [Azospirillum argentinense]|uniref:TAXI family TRAP transporter solute-binding subunit n=1 Tax=Azospirillum argentinense TaxID=2970906 RepID=UPI00214FFABB|nr:TAXI family TRAP transporter solute-binding subunit [Azospirillum argentinense]